MVIMQDTQSCSGMKLYYPVTQFLFIPNRLYTLLLENPFPV